MCDNKFYKARQPEGQMPIMLATYSTNKIIVLKRYVVKEEEKKKKNINQTNTRTQEEENTELIN